MGISFATMPKKGRKSKAPPKPWQNNFEGLSDAMETFVSSAKEGIFEMRSKKMLEEIDRASKKGLSELSCPRGGYASIPLEISELEGIEVLDLNHNIIDEDHIDETFFRNPNTQSIRILDLTSNRLQEIPKEIEHLINVEILKIGQNCITELPNEIGNLTKIKECIMDHNCISDLKESMGQWTNLTHFNMAFNNISTMPNSCANWVNLEVLLANTNSFIGIPVGVGMWKKLKKINMGNNSMGTLPEEIGHWKCIQELDFSGNALNALPESFDTLLTLKKIYLGHNDLKTNQIAGMSAMTKLEDLFLPKNLLEKGIPKDFGNLTNLRRVSFSANKMKSLPAEVGEWVKVEEVYLAQNDFEKLPSTIGNWKCLRELILTKCEQLQIITTALADIPTLVNLDLKETQVEIADEFKKIPQRIPPLYIRGGLQQVKAKKKK